MPSVVSFIPARGGSKSILQKNIKDLGGKPLIAWSIEVALKTTDRVIVNTDDELIKQVALNHGAEVMDRPTHLGKDTTSMLEVLRSEVPKISPKPEYILLLQPTSPFRESVYIKTAIGILGKNSQYDSLISVERVPEKYNAALQIISTPKGARMILGKAKSIFSKRWQGPSFEGFPISQRITRRQDNPESWVPTGEIYLFKTDNLKKGSMYGDKVMILEGSGSVNINTKEDFEEAEQWIQSTS